MAMSFEQTVAVPSTRDYAPPTPDIFSQIAGLPNAYYQGVFNKQQKQLNDQKIAQAQREASLQQAFPQGLPRDAQGNVDTSKVIDTFARFGAVPEAMKLNQQQPAPVPSFLSGQPQQQGGGSPAGSSGASSDVAATASKIIQAESGGDPNAKNPNSSAAGLGGFTDSTWLEAIKKYFPNLAQGRSDDQLLAMRKIPQLATRVTEAFTAGNEAGLAKAGLPVTPGTTYLAHFAGLGGAAKVLRADPNTPVSQLLSKEAIKANPFLQDMTARDLESWAARKMMGPAMAAQQAPSAAPDAPQAAPASGGVQIADASGRLPPSANAGSPAASAAPAQGPAPQTVGQAAPSGAGPAQPQPAQPQRQAQPAGRPLVQPVELPKGFTDPVQAMNFLRQYARANANNPKTSGYAEQADAWANRIEKSIAPMHVGSSIIDPRDGSLIYSAPQSGGQVGQLVRLENAERADRGEAPMTAREEIAFIQGIRPPRSAPAMAVEAFKKDFEAKNGRSPTGDEITKFAASYSGEQAYGRTAGSQGARVESASNEVEQLIPQAVEASRNYVRQGGKFVGINKLFQAYDQGTSDPKYNDFVLANFSLINAYTRAMNPQGVPRIQERLEQHAMGILSTATDEKAYEVQVRRLWKEVQASKTATAKTAEGRSAGDINSPVPGMDEPAVGGGKVSKDGWTVVTGPNGKKARIQEVTE